MNTRAAFNWEIRISDFAIACVQTSPPPDFFLREEGTSVHRLILQSNAKSENGFHLREIRPQGGFQLRDPNPDFMDFLFTVRLGNPKKDLQNCSREQRCSLC